MIFLKGADLRVKGKYIHTKLSDFFLMILVISILTCNIYFAYFIIKNFYVNIMHLKIEK